MNPHRGPCDDAMPPRLSDQIDVLCDWFEAEIRDGRTPRIEEVLVSAPLALRPRLLRELVALEVDLARRSGSSVDFTGYFARFPADAAVLDEVRAEFDSDNEHAQIATLTDRCETGQQSHPVKLEPETQIRQFRLLAMVGQGGFGTVWRALDTRLQREVAIKIPRADLFRRADISHLLEEARAAAMLRHAHIVSVHEVGEGDAETPPFIVTDFVEGPNLKQWMEAGPLPLTQIVAHVAKIARALEHAHSRGIIHRDLKPANVLLDAEGEPHLADFGLAKRLADEDSELVDGQLVGTPLYMAPEQARGEQGAVDRRTDVYSLGAILYELLAGRPPFRGSLQWLLEQIAEVPPRPLRQINPAIPDDLENLCRKCLSKDPAARYQTAGELADDLERFLAGESLRGVAVPMRRRLTKWVRRRRRFVTSLIATATLSLALAGGLWWWSLPPSPRRLVEFTTDPPGCEITVVKLDPVTGDPDPTQIEHARGMTPLRMKLVPADYLVVAVLDEQRFHEVIRHIPDSTETVKFARISQYWTAAEDGCIRTMSIAIPSSQFTDLIYVEGSADWKPYGHTQRAAGSMNVPPLLVDIKDHAVTRDDQGHGSPLHWNNYFSAEAYAEETGKRLPTSLELSYVIDKHQRPSSRTGMAAKRKSATSLQGLCELPWEWTMTKAESVAAVELGTVRILRGGRQEDSSEGGEAIRDPFRLERETQSGGDLGVRCVRSVRPRTSKEHFMRPNSTAR